MTYIDHIRALNSWDPENFLPFVVGKVRVGWIRHSFADQLTEYPSCFIVSPEQVVLHPELGTFEQRSHAVAVALQHMSDSGTIDHLMGEMFPVLEHYGVPALLQMDRAEVSRFGIRAFGQHLNGYVESVSGMKMWIARRASDRRAFPGRLDQIVAGGLPHGISLAENLAKECWEEAGITQGLAAKARAVGQVSYCCEVERGLRDDTLFCYDLLVPEDFIPCCTDGEVGSFELMSVEEVAAIVRDSDAFKPNCNLVMIDFLIRHGFIERSETDMLDTALNR